MREMAGSGVEKASSLRRTNARRLAVSVAGAALAAVVLQYSLTNPAGAAVPVMTLDSPAVSVDEGRTATNTGTFSDPGYATNFSASAGVVEKTGSDEGTWKWSYDAQDGSADGGSVSITASREDGGKDPESLSFDLQVNNVAPTASINAPASTQEDGSFVVSLGGVSDPSPVDTSAGFTYAFDCGDGFGPAGSESSATCSSGSQPGEKTVRARVSDKDGGSSEYSAAVKITAAPVKIKDTTAPVVRGLTPKQGVRILNRKPIVRALVTDNSALNKSNIQLYVAGEQVSAKRFSYKNNIVNYKSRALAMGKKRVRVVATDASGNRGAKVWSFRVVKSR